MKRAWLSCVLVGLWLAGCASSEPLFVVDAAVVDKGLPPDTIEQNPIDAAVNGPPADAIHVSPIGQDSSDCGATKQMPCQTIGFGITRAASYQPPRPVAVSGGTYLESLTLRDGVDVLGGFNSDFVRDGSGNSIVVIKGVLSERAIAVQAIGLAAETVIERLTIEAPDAVASGESSYALYVKDAPGLRVRSCVIVAGRGAAGVAGQGTATNAANGTNGGDGKAGGQNLLDPIEPFGCNNPEALGFGDRGLGGAATSLSGSSTICGKGPGGNGGFGGIDSCDGTPGESVLGASAGAVDVCSSTSAGQGGVGGSGGTQNKSTCEAVSVGGDGRPGCDGRDGTNGENGPAGSGGTTAGGFWVGGMGGDGPDGINDATGGGGGGGGGGGDCDWPDCLGKCVSDRAGGGGGGGSPGCPGRGGSGGTGGGGSFGVFVASSSATIEIKDCEISTSAGGPGGAGGAGQPGGTGGAGGKGGAAFQESGSGAAGGKGGDGGAGGAGGGGAGGPSIGIYVVAGSTPAVMNTKFTLGQPGKGGASTGNPGLDGVVADVGPK